MESLVCLGKPDITLTVRLELDVPWGLVEWSMLSEHLAREWAEREYPRIYQAEIGLGILWFTRYPSASNRRLLGNVARIRKRMCWAKIIHPQTEVWILGARVVRMTSIDEDEPHLDLTVVIEDAKVHRR